MRARRLTAIPDIAFFELLVTSEFKRGDKVLVTHQTDPTMNGVRVIGEALDAPSLYPSALIPTTTCS